MKTQPAVFAILLSAITTFAIGQADLDEPDHPGEECRAETTMVSESSSTGEESNGIALEDWMVTPFETITEEVLSVEPWMKEPFATKAKKSHIRIVVEEWMLASR